MTTTGKVQRRVLRERERERKAAQSAKRMSASRRRVGHPASD